MFSTLTDTAANAIGATVAVYIDMTTGIVVQLVYLVVFGAIALVCFRRKDIRS